MKSDVTKTSAVNGEYINLDGEEFFKISNSQEMPEFFMSLVGSGDHWMFISSEGALSAGRRNADNALFPYMADDQISAARAGTGSMTLIRVKTEDPLNGLAHTKVWEPFAAHDAGTDRLHRNLYKNSIGNKVVFEEVNESLQLSFRYRWAFSQRFGFVRTCRLVNFGETPRSVELVDGLSNVLPYGVGNEFLMRYSNLANAYKKSELVPDSGLGLFYLSSIPTDRAEPSEGLKSTVVWQVGLSPDTTLLSTEQLLAFREGDTLRSEVDVRGKAGAYLLGQSLELASGDSLDWHVGADLAQDHAGVVALDDWLQNTSDPEQDVQDDIHASELEFLRIMSAADAIQSSSNKRQCNRHFSNTVFNVMRGGIPLENYQVHADDFRQYVANYNRGTFGLHQSILEGLPDVLSAGNLRSEIEALADPDLTRIGLEYLPLAFSRRHGDPTRPWNRFSIDLQSESGQTNLNYQGNWRDIFQNWEALIVSFPEFSTAMICRFVNATTADGYNPYRLTRDGFEWEEPMPDDPWANIGYWGDHQIIYLLKLLEWTRDFYPERLDALLNSQVFTHANVPYRIKGYEEIKTDARDTIDFDSGLSAQISERVDAIGADGKLLCDARGNICHVTLVEKLLTLSLAKMSNFVPDGGIWLNTQRPEWNDANNALVGNGLSMVTTYYLYRWFKFLHKWISVGKGDTFRVSSEVAELFERIYQVLRTHDPEPSVPADGRSRAALVDALAEAGSDYRKTLYAHGLTGSVVELSGTDCLEFFQTALRHLEVTIRNNKRPDGLYHSYNLLDIQGDELEVEHLYEMLEGQVAVLSSGLLGASEAVTVLDALRDSALYRQNQDSYMLYPDRQLPRFLEKNQISDALIEGNSLLQDLLARDERRIVVRDIRGNVHFNGRFRNSAELKTALNDLGENFTTRVEEHGRELVQMFDDVFGHRHFTGRSGTFFAYEGLGSIYWHMVSKLGLAVAENYFWALESDASADSISALRSHYQAVKRGIGAEKSPTDYGAFPTDPYSHTPENAGVKQPGMTGQVKEDVLARFGEVGICIEDGCVRFRLDLFDQMELLSEGGEFSFFDLRGQQRVIAIPVNGIGFTLFQVPFTYEPGDQDRICVHFKSGEIAEINGRQIDGETSRKLFSRSGEIERITCQFPALQQ